ncbi:nitrogenase component 1 [Succinivibrio dextrinosolvens]|uniref:nitrogenase component 1 n=1 Tax=Succinivibrio dextrinosolvens TaxID=83771 RepID=UPI00241EE2BB|nr:nitrogenase component 1 [Succinivibrio dextrinosolvens]MBE6421881.1 nitrogenase [Succinivibrio dextrinosolvens]
MKQINLALDTVENREMRLGSITSWTGTASDLVMQSNYEGRSLIKREFDCGKKNGCRLCELEMPFNQQSMCANSIASCQAGNLRDCVLIQHSPVGCTARNPEFNLAMRNGLARRNLEPRNINIVTTNLMENDMVFGASEKLRKTVQETFDRYHPKAIFLSMSCSTAIIGEDITSVADEMEEELGIPVIPLHCEGFRSKHWSTGFDIAQHGVLRQITKRNPKKQKDLINIVALWGTDYFTDMLKPLGLRVNYIMDIASFDELAQTSEAVATTTFCHTLGSYLATGLEQHFGLPQIDAPQPYGIKGTDEWLRAIARVVDKVDETEKYIQSEHERVHDEIEALKAKLKGVKGFVITGSAYAHGLISVLRELGIEVNGSVVFHHDPVYDGGKENQDTLKTLVENYGDIPNYSVSKTQPFQLPVILRNVDTDFIIVRHNGLAPNAARMGIPSFAMGDEHFPVGYDGIIRTGKAILDILARKKFNQVLKRHVKLPYSDWWLAQNDPFILARDPELIEIDQR